jgi:hypothetical protein
MFALWRSHWKIRSSLTGPIEGEQINKNATNNTELVWLKKEGKLKLEKKFTINNTVLDMSITWHAQDRGQQNLVELHFN